MARLIGDAYIVIYPQTDQFGPRTQAAVTKALSAVRGSVNVRPQLDKNAAARVQAEINGITGDQVNIKAALDPGALARIRGELAALTNSLSLGATIDPAALAGIKAQLERITENVQVNAVLDPAALTKIEAELHALTENVEVQLGISPAQIAATKAIINSAFASGTPVNLRVGVSPANIAAAKAALSAAFGTGTGIPITPTVNPATVAAVKAAVNTYMNNPAVQLQLNTMSAMAKIAALAAYMKGVLGTAMTVNWGGAIAQMLTVSAAASAIGASFAQMRANIVAANALAGTTTTLWAAFFTGATTGWGVLTSRISLFAGAFDSILPHILSSVSVWHLAVDWVAEFAAVLVPATLGLIAFGAAVTPVVADAVVRLQSMQEAAAALGVSVGLLGTGAGSATGPIQTLQNKLQPAVWEVYGDAITVMLAKAGPFQTVVKSMTTVIENLAARMTEAFSSTSATSFMNNASLDFQRFGTIIGNLGGAFGNFLKAVPGYAEIIQELFVQISKLIENITAFTIPVMHAALALHGFIIYVGLAATAGVALLAGIGNVAKGFFTFAASATNLTTVTGSIVTAFKGAGAAALAFGKNLVVLLANPYVDALLVLGAAAYAVVTNFDSASTSVSNFTRSITTSIANMQGGDALQSIPAALAKINEQIKIAGSPAAFQQLSANWSNLSNTANAFTKDSEANLKDWGNAFKSLVTGSSGSQLMNFITGIGHAIKTMFVPGEGISIQMSDNIKALETAFNQLSGQEKNLLGVSAELMTGQGALFQGITGGTKTTYTWAQALGILDAAGVQASDSLQMMETKVQGFLQGWSQFGLNASQIGNAVNALALQSEMSQTSISKLTGAYSNFIGVVTGGESAFTTFGTGLGTLNQALSSAGAAGVTFTDTLGKFSVTGTAVGATMNGISQASLNVRGAFATEVTNATNLYNSLLTLSSVSAQGAQGQNLLAQAGKDMVATLLPLAKGSSTAMAEVSALAQLAGGPATTSFQVLSKWVGNVKDPMEQLNQIEGKLTVASSNLYQDTMNLAGAMNQTLTSAISGAIFAAEKGPQALQNLANSLADLANHKGDVTEVQQALTASIPALVQMSGSSKLAEDQFIAMAGAFHISAAQATAMWNAVAPNKKALADLTTESKALASASAVNSMAMLLETNALGLSTTAYNQLWAVVAKNNVQLTAGAGYATTAKNAFISYAENGLNFTSTAANRLWASGKAQNLIDLAGKAGTTKSAFIDMAKNGLGLSTTMASQLWTELRLQYLDTLVAKGKGAETQFINLAKSGLDLSTSAATNLWNTLKAQYLDTLAAKANTTAGAFVQVAKQFGVSNSAAVTLWTSLQKLPANVKVAIDETIAGGGKIVVQGNIVANQSTGIATSTVTGEQTFNGYAYASGGVVPAGGGPAGRDSKLAMVAPGELIIPTSHAPKFADMAKRSGIPGFAAGGVMGQADSVAAMNAQVVPAARNYSVPIVGDAGVALVSAMAKQLQTIQASMQSISMAGVSNASSLAALESAAAKAGWTGAQWTALFNVEMREAGFSTSAQNPSSGAYGMAQFINGPSEYAQYGGNSTTAAGQAVAMVNYIKSRYGTPAAAWAHEQQFGWYNQGGVVPGGKGYSAGGMISEPVFGYGKFSGMPYSFAENGPEQVVPGGAALAQNQQLPGMTTFQATRLLNLMEQQNKLLAQLPYSQAQAINQAQAAGVRRGYFATSG